MNASRIGAIVFAGSVGVAVGASVTAAPPPADILLKHSPINPLAGETVTYSARATSPNGVSSIGISFEAFRIECINGAPTLTDQIDAGAAGSGQGPDPPTVVEFQMAVGPFPQDTWIVVEAGASPQIGPDVKHLYQHTATLSDEMIECIGAAPIYIGGNGTKADSNFNVLFIADSDFATQADYFDMVHSIIFDTDIPLGLFAEVQLAPFKDRFNLFLNDFEFKGQPAWDPDGDPMNPQNHPHIQMPYLDVFLFVHDTPYQDKGQLNQPTKTGTLGQASADGPNVAVHELGHSLAALRDEYICSDCDVATSTGPHPNIFVSEDECRDHVLAFHPAGDAAECRKVSNFDVRWHWCMNNDVMDDNSELSPPGLGEEISQYAALISMMATPGGGFTLNAPDGPLPPASSLINRINNDLNRLFDAECLLISFSSNTAGGMVLHDVCLVGGLCRLPRGIEPSGGPVLEVRLLDAIGGVIHSFLLPDQRIVGGGSGDPDGTPTDTAAVNDWDLKIPWKPPISNQAVSLLVLDDAGTVLLDVAVPGPPGCLWDCADADGDVGIVDLLTLLAQWGEAGACDFDGGGVGVSDLLTLLANWGPCP